MLLFLPILYAALHDAKGCTLMSSSQRRKRPLKFTQIATEEPMFEGPVVYAHIGVYLSSFRPILH